MTYVWVDDGDSRLNVFLVRNGCCPAGSMSSAGLTLLVPQKDYDVFISQVEAAEQAAKKEGLGIWKSPPR
jgi:endonuclease YncB( thermonuclease family)